MSIVTFLADNMNTNMHLGKQGVSYKENNNLQHSAQILYVM